MDKPEGPTSHDVVAMVRRARRARRAGHAGTLDPLASGLLIVLLDRATRLARFLAELPKTYDGELALGVTTDSDDRTGATLASSDRWRTLPDDAVVQEMARLTGTYLQRPPAYSARKVGGERAYRLARRGAAVALTAREVVVRRFAMVNREGARVRFAADVSSGTYVRALARDLGERLGCGAHLTALRRIAVGPFRVADALTVDDAAVATPRPPLDAVRHLPSVALDAALRDRVAHGQPIAVPGPGGGPVALVADDALVAVAVRRGDLLKPVVVLAP